MDIKAQTWLADIFGYSGLEYGEMTFPAGQRGLGIVFREANFRGQAELVQVGCSIPIMVSSQSRHGVRSFIFPPSKSLTMTNATGENTSAAHSEWWVVGDSCAWFKNSAAVTFLFAPVTERGRIPPRPRPLPFEHCLGSPARNELQRVIEQRTQHNALMMCFSETNFRGETKLFTKHDRIDFGTINSIRHLGSPNSELDGGASLYQSMIIIPPWKLRFFLCDDQRNSSRNARSILELESNQWHFISDLFEFFNQYFALSHLDWKVEDRVNLYCPAGVDDGIDGADGTSNRALALDLPANLFDNIDRSSLVCSSGGGGHSLPHPNHHHHHHHSGPHPPPPPPPPIPPHHHPPPHAEFPGHGLRLSTTHCGNSRYFATIRTRSALTAFFIIVILLLFAYLVLVRPRRTAGGMYSADAAVSINGDAHHNGDADDDYVVMQDMLKNM